MSLTRLDARGMRCPWPVLRLAKVMREGAAEVFIRADDPAAPQEIAALAVQNGWLVRSADDGWIVSRNRVSFDL